MSNIAITGRAEFMERLGDMQIPELPNCVTLLPGKDKFVYFAHLRALPDGTGIFRVPMPDGSISLVNGRYIADLIFGVEESS